MGLFKKKYNQNDMINLYADMKVFNSMLKADGYDDEEIIKEDNNE